MFSAAASRSLGFEIVLTVSVTFAVKRYFCKSSQCIEEHTVRSIQLYPCYNSASLRAWGLSYRVTDAGAGTTGPLGVRGWERRRAPRHKRSRAASDRAETRVAGLANALEDSMYVRRASRMPSEQMLCV